MGNSPGKWVTPPRDPLCRSCESTVVSFATGGSGISPIGFRPYKLVLKSFGLRRSRSTDCNTVVRGSAVFEHLRSRPADSRQPENETEFGGQIMRQARLGKAIGRGAYMVAPFALTVSAAVAAPLPGGTLDPLTVPKYVTPLVIPPVMKSTGTANDYDIAVRQFQQQILPGGIGRVCPAVPPEIAPSRRPPSGVTARRRTRPRRSLRMPTASSTTPPTRSRTPATRSPQWIGSTIWWPIRMPAPPARTPHRRGV